ncbi:hypothetical protein JRQ81_012274 [Phrynocephalus forsythii]|uniref:Ig-like domain-containing protein n=1 Tax=Phrynocephalus forsythii TaxID=171643 RepID=A0A9Q0X5J9_9SAUR|nr:hypothetical protein JRQ81_012274 [Phrynocephalus forsythii]
MVEFIQKTLPSGREAGELLYLFDQEEILHVDWDQQQTVWRLPDLSALGDVRGPEGAGEPGRPGAQPGDYDELHQPDAGPEWYLEEEEEEEEEEGLVVPPLSPLDPNQHPHDIPPSATVYPKNPVELREPNVLICFVDRFSLPVLNITWLKNRQVVSKGVQETGFLPSQDWTFRQFSYLPFIPEEGDLYACQVDHWGLQESLIRPWDPKLPPPASETPVEVLCGLGLAFGILGAIAGPLLFFKARKMDRGM